MGALGVYSRGFYLPNTVLHFSNGVGRTGSACVCARRSGFPWIVGMFLCWLCVHVCRSQIPCSARQAWNRHPRRLRPARKGRRPCCVSQSSRPPGESCVTLFINWHRGTSYEVVRRRATSRPRTVAVNAALDYVCCLNKSSGFWRCADGFLVLFILDFQFANAKTEKAGLRWVKAVVTE